MKANVDRVVAAIHDLPLSDQRRLIAIAGPPASGKSTLAEHVQKRLQDTGIQCGLVPMDGFHLDNDVLQARGLLARKGSPETFDVKGFRTLVERLFNEDTVQIPLFDRANDCVRPNAETIKPSEKIVLVEGNYLLLDDPAWQPLRKFWTLKIFTSPSIHTLQKRLIDRWLKHGLDHSAAKKRAKGNDLVNAKLILQKINQDTIDVHLK